MPPYSESTSKPNKQRIKHSACIVYTLVMKMEKICYSEMSVKFYQTTLCHILLDAAERAVELTDCTQDVQAGLHFTCLPKHR
jgi:hypothetical protein